MNTQKFISEAYGFTNVLPLDMTAKNSKGKITAIFDIPEKHKKFIKITKENTSQRCIMCGNIHKTGYYSEKGANHFLNTFISGTYNWVYKFKSEDNFICEYCAFNSVSYNSPSKSPLGKKMVNVLIEKGKVRQMNFNSDVKGDLYGVLKNPPSPPFVILANPPGTVLYNMTFTATATISKGIIVVNYGMDSMRVKPSEVFQSIEDAKVIAQKYGIDADKDQIWNRQNDVSISSKLTSNSDFVKDIGIFIGKYDRDCRIVAKIIYLAYSKENKNTKSQAVKSVKKTQASLLDELY